MSSLGDVMGDPEGRPAGPGVGGEPVDPRDSEAYGEALVRDGLADPALEARMAAARAAARPPSPAGGAPDFGPAAGALRAAAGELERARPALGGEEGATLCARAGAAVREARAAFNRARIRAEPTPAHAAAAEALDAARRAADDAEGAAYAMHAGSAAAGPTSAALAAAVAAIGAAVKALGHCA